MSSKLLSLSIVAGSLALTLPTATFAKPIRYVGPEALKGLCQSNNGTFLPQTPDLPVYVCIKGGSIVMCGGVGKYKWTCEGHTSLKRRAIVRRLKGHSGVVGDR